MKKRISYILACICITLCMMPQFLNAQNSKPLNMPFYDDEPYHFGLIVGYNHAFYSIEYKDGYQNILHDAKQYLIEQSGYSINDGDQYVVNDINTSLGHGFTVGIIGNLRLAKYIDLRAVPSFSIVGRNVYYDITLIKTDMTRNSLRLASETEHICIELPIHIKYKSQRYNNTAGYIIAGANYKIDWYSNNKKNFIENKPRTIICKSNDIAAEIGAGFDFYTNHFKLGVELKMSYGLFNVANPDYSDFVFTNSIEKLKNKTFQLSFTFE